MKQVLQDLKNGSTRLAEAPSPKVVSNHLLIETIVSLISTGTERMLVDFSKGNLVQKAVQQPEKVRQVVDKIGTDGLLTTVDAVRSKLGQPLPLGYCNVGTVIDVGHGVTGFKVGDRVASNGPHADVVRVSKNLSARIPDRVDNETAVFTVPAAIGIQGIRLAKPTIGEAFVVFGAGLIGLLTVQMLLAQGCRVLVIEIDPVKLKLAGSFGAETCNPSASGDPIAAGLSFSRGHGVDGVIITATTKSHDVLSQAAKISRQRGRIILVGVVGLNLNRSDFYEKELTFQVSCSYGPGRYDPKYEEGGQDYPYGLVRWTQQRNFEAALDLMAAQRIDVSKLITHQFEFENSVEAYNELHQNQSALGIVLNHSHEGGESRQRSTIPLVASSKTTKASAKSVVGVIGAGNYASRILIPAFKTAGARLHTLASSGGISTVVHGERNGFEYGTSDTDSLIGNSEINIVAIVTRHNSHARLTATALQSGKHVFVEKPLVLTFEELELVEEAYADANQVLMVGFNRRFAPLVQKMRLLLSKLSSPKTFIMTMNAGMIPKDHWTQDIEVGGGRIIGEACHYIDLMRFLAGATISSVQVRGPGKASRGLTVEDNATIVLSFSDGSFGTIHYIANGGSSFPKERIEVFSEGRTLQLDNFLKLRGFNWPGFRSARSWRQDKGQKRCVQAFVSAVTNNSPPPISAEELFEVARVTLEVGKLLREQNV